LIADSCRTAVLPKHYFAKYRHARVKLAPHCCSTLAQSIVAWGLIAKRTFGTGCSEFNPDHRPRFRATMSRAKSREIGMIEATKRGASEALAQMLAMTAMLAIASVAFYWCTP
jgi:hypothetical protein